MTVSVPEGPSRPVAPAAGEVPLIDQARVEILGHLVSPDAMFALVECSNQIGQGPLLAEKQTASVTTLPTNFSTRSRPIIEPLRTLRAFDASCRLRPLEPSLKARSLSSTGADDELQVKALLKIGALPFRTALAPRLTSRRDWVWERALR